MSRLRVLATAVALAALVVTSSAGHATGAGGLLPTEITISSPPDSVVVGARVTVSGSVLPSDVGTRGLSLQFKTAKGWRQVAQGSAGATGSYELRVPTSWYGRHVLRVVAEATTVAARGVSPKRAVTVTPGYDPRGSASSWKRFAVHARWDPCRTIPVKANLRRAPEGSKKLVKRALRIVHAATGLPFDYAGRTTKVPFSRESTSKQFLKRGLVIAWSTPRKVPSLAGSTAGVGGASSTSTNGGPYEYLFGGVSIDATQKLPVKGFGDGKSTGALLLHELGHAIGLDHTGARAQVMYPSLQSTFKGRYEAGDLAGLRAVGAAGGCF